MTSWKTLLWLCPSVFLAACTPAAAPLAPHPAAACAPTGWVDRVEERIAVVDPDEGEEFEYYPSMCFPEPPRGGTRVVAGRIDWEETERMRREIQALVDRLTVEQHPER